MTQRAALISAAMLALVGCSGGPSPSDGGAIDSLPDLSPAPGDGPASSGASLTVATYVGTNRGDVLWIGARPEGGAWEAAQHRGSGDYAFAFALPADGRYTIVVACRAENVRVLSLTAAETTAPLVVCDDTRLPLTRVSGSIAGMPPGHCAGGIIGTHLIATSCPTTGYAFSAPAGVYDLAAVLHPIDLTHPADAFALVRDYPLGSATTAAAVDVSHATATVAETATVSGAYRTYASGAVYYRTRRGTFALLGYAPTTAATSFGFGAVPVAAQVDGEIHDLSASTFDATTADIQHLYFKSPTAPTADFSSAPSWPAPAMRFVANAPGRIAADFTPFNFAVLFQLEYDYVSEPDAYHWSAIASAGWLTAAGGGGAPSYTLPELAGAPGWNAAWSLPAEGIATQTNPIRWRATAARSVFPLAPLLATLDNRVDGVVDGMSWRAITQLGTLY